MMNNDNDMTRTATANAMRDAIDRRLAAQREMRDSRWMPETINRPAPRARRNSVPHRSIR